MEGETKFADIILPACTNFERWDVAEFANCSGYVADSYTQCNHRVIVLQSKCIEPLGESRSDYDIFAELAKRLGIYEIFSAGGKDEYDWTKQVFHATDLPNHVTWEEFAEKGYFVVPVNDKRDADPRAALVRRRSCRRTRPTGGRTRPISCAFRGLSTTSGKIEFVSSSLSRLEKTGTVDPERPVMGPQYIELVGGPQHDRSLRQVSAADGVATPAVQLPHHG